MRNLDGFYFRVERDGKWVSICFSDLIEQEMEDMLNNRKQYGFEEAFDFAKSIAIGLGKTIQALGNEFDIIKK